MRKRSIEILAKLCLTTPKRAIVDALVDAKSLSKREIEQLVDELKRSSEELVPPPSRARKQVKVDGSPVARIKRLLTVEAGLTPVQSMIELKGELRGVSLPQRTGGSFDDWLQLLLDAVPAGEVLNAAMVVARRTKPRS